MGSKPKPISLLAYGKRRGVSCEAVRKAIESGRLDRSVVVVRGKPKIADPELADREWEENTRPRADRAPAPQTSGVGPAGDGTGGSGDDAIDYAEARRRREVELWRQARIKRESDELELALRKGELVPVAEARATVLERYATVKTRLLGVPVRARQRLPHLAADDVRVIDDFIREALEELANGGGAAEGEPEGEPEDEDGDAGE